MGKNKKKTSSLNNILTIPEEEFFSFDTVTSPFASTSIEEPFDLECFIHELDSSGQATEIFPTFPSACTTVKTRISSEVSQDISSHTSASKKGRSVHEFEVAKYLVEKYPAGLFQNIPYFKINGVHTPLTDRLVGKLIDSSFEDTLKNGISSKNFGAIQEWVHVLLDNEDHTLHIPPRTVLFENGAYDFVSRKKVHVNDTDFIPVRINARYYPDELPDTPVFDQFLDNCAAGDSEVRNLILAFLGYMISPGSAKHLIVMGPAPDSGKTLLGNFTRDLLGRKNTCAISLHKFSNSFEMAQLLGKSANFCLDISGAVLNENTVATLKRLTGSDPETLNAKYKAPIQYENFAKMVFACNEGGLRLRTPDKGFENRLVVIPFLKSVAANDIDPDLPDKLWAERDGIVWHAFSALRELYLAKYRFPYCRSGELLKKKWMRCADMSIQEFLDDACIMTEEERTWTAELYEAYRLYCKDKGLSPVTDRTFARALRSVPDTFPDKWQKGHTQLRGISGIGLKF